MTSSTANLRERRRTRQHRVSRRHGLGAPGAFVPTDASELRATAVSHRAAHESRRLGEPARQLYRARVDDRRRFDTNTLRLEGERGRASVLVLQRRARVVRLRRAVRLSQPGARSIPLLAAAFGRAPAYAQSTTSARATGEAYAAYASALISFSPQSIASISRFAGMRSASTPRSTTTSSRRESAFSTTAIPRHRAAHELGPARADRAPRRAAGAGWRPALSMLRNAPRRPC